MCPIRCQDRESPLTLLSRLGISLNGYIMRKGGAVLDLNQGSDGEVAVIGLIRLPRVDR